MDAKAAISSSFHDHGEHNYGPPEIRVNFYAWSLSIHLAQQQNEVFMSNLDKKVDIPPCKGTSAQMYEYFT